MSGKNLSRCVLAVAVVLAVSHVQEARAQGRRGGGGMQPQGVSPLTVAASEAVQKELALKPEQAEKVKALVADFRKEAQSARQESGIDIRGLRDLPAEERTKKMAELSAISKKVSDKFTGKLDEILDKTQQTRLHEIAIQFAGASALQDAAVVKDLGLSKEQTDKLAAINKDFGAKRRELATGGADRAEMAAKLKEMREEHSTKANEVLTKDQQAQFAKMKGSAFDVSQIQQGQGQGQGRRRRAAANNN